jgi:hypothetical protein
MIIFCRLAFDVNTMVARRRSWNFLALHKYFIETISPRGLLDLNGIASNSKFEFEFRRAITENGQGSNKTGMGKGKQ